MAYDHARIFDMFFDQTKLKMDEWYFLNAVTASVLAISHIRALSRGKEQEIIDTLHNNYAWFIFDETMANMIVFDQFNRFEFQFGQGQCSCDYLQ